MYAHTYPRLKVQNGSTAKYHMLITLSANLTLVSQNNLCCLNGLIFVYCKISEFYKNPPLSGAKKHPDFQVTRCLRFVTTNVDFAYIESEISPFLAKI